MKKLKKVRMVLIVVQFVCLIVFVSQVVLYYQNYEENIRLGNLKQEYQMLKEKISSYNELKNNYLVVLEEGQGLSDEYSGLKGKVEELNKQISSLQGQIDEVKKKIASIS